MIYRVVLKVGYCEAFFDFDEAESACNFAMLALTHSVACDDTKKATKITLQIVNPVAEKEEEDE